MNGHDPASDPWPPWWDWNPDDYAGEPAATADVNMLGDYYTDEPLELIGQGESGGDMGWRTTVSGLCSSSRGAAPLPPPSDAVMAAWLYPIVSGKEHAGNRDDDTDNTTSYKAPVAMEGSEPSMVTESLGVTMVTADSRGKLPTPTDVTHDVKETNTKTSGFIERIRKQATPSRSKTRSSNHSGTHSITEKRRRCRITERLRTLRQLVPGSGKCTQASTLEQTIQYMKSLQQQVQAMKTSTPAMPPPAVVAGAGALQVRPAVGTMVVPPFRAELPSYRQYYYHHAVMMPSAAPPASAYWPAATSAALSAAPAAGDHDGGLVARGSAKRKSRAGTEDSRFSESIDGPNIRRPRNSRTSGPAQPKSILFS